MPKQIRQELAQFARKLRRDYPGLFARSQHQKARRPIPDSPAATETKAPRKARTPERHDCDTVAALKRLYPNERPVKTWERIYPQAIPGCASMSELEQADARQELRERVRWRIRARKLRAPQAT